MTVDQEYQVFSDLIALADSIAERAVRSRGREFSDLAPADWISGAEIEALCDDAVARARRNFGAESVLVRLVEEAIELPEVEGRHPADEAFLRQQVRAERIAGVLTRLDGFAAERALPASRTIVLTMASSPLDMARLRLDEESRAIDAAIRGAEFRDQFEIRQWWATRGDDVQSALLRHSPGIVHFSGHATTASEIVLQDEAGLSHPMPRQALTDLFSITRGTTRCVVLNACYSQEQAEGIGKVVDCVVGMDGSMGDESATRFSTAFYRALAYGRSVRDAFNLGRNALETHGSAYFTAPHLVASDVDAGAVYFAGPKVSVDANRSG